MAERRFSERTAWARNVAAPLRDFLTTETGGAVVLLCATAVVLLCATVDARARAAAVTLHAASTG